MYRIVAIIQARLGSSRLPGKMLLDLGGHPILFWVITRLNQAKRLSEVILATTDKDHDDPLAALGHQLELPVFRGNETDVLGRFQEAARMYNADLIVRICADNPLIAPEEIDRLVDFYLACLTEGGDPLRMYAFNHIPAMETRYPNGLGAEILSIQLLERLDYLSDQPLHREHVTLYLWEHPDAFDIRPVPAPAELAHPEMKLDVDTLEDLKMLRVLCARLSVTSSATEIIRTYLDIFGPSDH
jgi:spore coat polysaccharide biosynthesis protein SpsF